MRFFFLYKFLKKIKKKKSFEFFFSIKFFKDWPILVALFLFDVLSLSFMCLGLRHSVFFLELSSLGSQAHPCLVQGHQAHPHVVLGLRPTFVWSRDIRHILASSQALGPPLFGLGALSPSLCCLGPQAHLCFVQGHQAHPFIVLGLRPILCCVLGFRPILILSRGIKPIRMLSWALGPSMFCLCLVLGFRSILVFSFQGHSAHLCCVLGPQAHPCFYLEPQAHVVSSRVVTLSCLLSWVLGPLQFVQLHQAHVL